MSKVDNKTNRTTSWTPFSSLYLLNLKTPIKLVWYFSAGLEHVFVSFHWVSLKDYRSPFMVFSELFEVTKEKAENINLVFFLKKLYT